MTTVDTLAAPSTSPRPDGSPSSALAAVPVVGFSVGRFVLSSRGPTWRRRASPAPRRARRQALAKLERDVERSPDDPGALTSLAAAYISTAITVEDTSYFGKAEALLDRADAIVPRPRRR